MNRRTPGRGALAVLAGLVVATGAAVVWLVVLDDGGGYDTSAYTDAVVERFDDGNLMHDEDSRCVATAVEDSIDWRATKEAGIAPEDLFGEAPLTEQFEAGEIDSLIAAIDTCRGAADLVLEIFAAQGEMDDAQLSCFASRITTTASTDLLRLIIADDQVTFAGSDGEILLGVCGRGVSE